MPLKKSIIHIITALVGMMSLFVILIVPIAYFLKGVAVIHASMQAETEINSRLISSIISKNPKMWKYETLRMLEYLDRRPTDRTPEIREVLNEKGQVITRSFDALKSPLITEELSLYDFGQVVGTIRISRSSRPVINKTLILFLALLPVGVLTFFIVRIFPIKLLDKSQKEALWSEQKYQNLLGAASDGILLLEGNTKKIMDANQKILTMLGYSNNKLLSMSLHTLFPEELKESNIKILDECISTGTVSQVLMRKKDGGNIAMEVTGSAIKTGTGSIQQIIMRDVTERMKYEDHIRHLAYYDSLTGLPNFVFLKELITKTIVNARRNKQIFAVLLFDIDFFKRINDTFGHSSGDRLLKDVADHLQKITRESDVLSYPVGSMFENQLSRMGGDEFILLLNNIKNTHDVSKVADRIIKGINSIPFSLSATSVYVSLSAGISTFPYDGEDTEALIKNADIAMYHVKARGRNNFQFYSEAINTDNLAKLALENELYRAISHNEFELHYQPIKDIKNEKVGSVEALIRWQHPKMGIVPPSQFISFAEESGLIIKIGDWVVHTACEQIKAWRKDGLESIKIAVNISASQFDSKNFFTNISKALRDTSVEPRCLEFEITEGAIMRDPEKSLLIIENLKKIGTCIVLDDFGTGYSSLSYLKKFPFDKIKIDRSFIAGVPQDKNNVALISAIVAVGHAMNMKIVAEGVETPEQLEIVRHLGCDEFQGFLISHPMPPEMVKDFILEER